MYCDAGRAPADNETNVCENGAGSSFREHATKAASPLLICPKSVLNAVTDNPQMVAFHR
jgi:hypothetical protein